MVYLARVCHVNKEYILLFISFLIFVFLCHLPDNNFSFFFTHKLLISVMAPGIDGKLTTQKQELEVKQTHKACCHARVHSAPCSWHLLRECTPSAVSFTPWWFISFLFWRRGYKISHSVAVGFFFFFFWGEHSSYYICKVMSVWSSSVWRVLGFHASPSHRVGF